MKHATKLLFAASLFLVGAGVASAQTSACAQRYDDAKNLFDNGDRKGCIELIASTLDSCKNDKEQTGRLLFLKSLAEAGEDSLDRMRHDLEQLFRNDRGFVVRAYDPVMKGKAGEAELFGAWEILGLKLRKDQGKWRAGIQASGQRSLLDVSSDRQVFENDAALDHTGTFGWEIAANTEWDALHNVALRLSAGYSELNYEATSSTQRYSEKLTVVPVSLGVKKMFWMKDSPWVPYVMVEGTYGRLLSAMATIERSGDGLRFLSPKTLDRVNERTEEQLWAGGTVGIGHKVGDLVVFLEGRYRQALTTLNRDATYTESELLTNYYWLDKEISLSSAGVTFGVQYVLRYHARNRIY